MTQTPRDVAISMANVASGESGRISGYAQSTLYMQMHFSLSLDRRENKQDIEQLRLR